MYEEGVQKLLVCCTVGNDSFVAFDEVCISGLPSIVIEGKTLCDTEGGIDCEAEREEWRNVLTSNEPCAQRFYSRLFTESRLLK